ncbi:DUF6455 family protein [Seohaeicola saemankumensis]|uniref:DUF6455 family protein n=1 Tax=Seohaeicola saemankumensis TaxID=481181 RepID=A0ABW3THE0_9RHOB
MILHLGDPDRHFWLVRSVARVMGISLGEALLQGAMEQDACRRMIDRCRTCAVVRACHDWLAESSGRADAPPPGCVISTDLNRLKCMTRSKGAH